jgi:small-conductance mechanosensitive channel
MTFTELLDHIWLGNAISRWLIALGIFLGVIIILWPVKRWIVRRMAAFASTTETHLDDLVAAVLKSTRFAFVAVIAMWAGSRVLVLPNALLIGLEKAAVVVIVLQVGFWATTFLKEWLKIVAAKKEADGEVLTWLGGVEWAGKIIIWAIALLIGLENLGVDVTGLVAGLGIGGIAVALAAQSILGDLFSAFSIYIDKPFVLGDYLKVGDQMGTVENIGMKTTRLRSLTGEQLIFGNSDLVGSRIQNFGRLNERRANFSVGVTYDTPKDKIEGIPSMIREIVESQDQVRFDRSHFREFGDSALVFDTVYYVLVPAFQVKMDSQQAINLELMQRFEAEGIEFAFPTQTIYLENAESATE